MEPQTKRRSTLKEMIELLMRVIFTVCGSIATDFVLNLTV